MTPDGNGDLAGVDTVSNDGLIGRRTFTGTYTVNGNCTGSAKFQFSDGSTKAMDFALSNGGKAINFIDSDNNVIVNRYGDCAIMLFYSRSGSLGARRPVIASGFRTCRIICREAARHQPATFAIFGTREKTQAGRGDKGLMDSSVEMGVCPKMSRNFLDGFFLRLRTSSRSITTSCSYVVPSMRIEPKENFSKRIRNLRRYYTVLAVVRERCVYSTEVLGN